MIDPIHSLAFSVQANPGVYAVLVGSGLSRAARIPTGWEITLDLVRKLAAVCKEDCGPAPEDWYRRKYGREADYSELLDALAKTPPERQQLLRGYWEATEQEREDGVKGPTPAHRAIAALAAQGYVRVIVTTNFDRLIETALVDAGITPTVLSSPDHVLGALPLIHSRCSVFKVNGDYLDTRIRNTPTELRSYPPEFERLLDTIFDEFGLIVCGWSADWDDALRSAITRAPSRRFSCYWTARGDLGEEAAKLTHQRGAHVIPIRDADSFWTALVEQVRSIEEFSRPHPLSTEAAVASLKRFLSEPKYRIQLADLVVGEVERVRGATSTPVFACQGGPSPDAKSFTLRVRAYEGASQTLTAMALTGGYWAEQSHFELWERTVAQLAVRRENTGLSLWIELQRYPATLLMYALGLGALASRRLKFLSSIFTTPVYRENRDDLFAVQLLPPFCLFERGNEPVNALLEGMERRYAPLNDWIHDRFKPLLKPYVANEDRYTVVFDELEILIALGYARHAKRTKDWYWAPPGAYGYRGDNRERVLTQIEASIRTDGDGSQYVAARLFGDTAAECTTAIKSFREFVGGFHWH